MKLNHSEFLERMRGLLGKPRYTMVGTADPSKFRRGQELSSNVTQAKINVAQERHMSVPSCRMEIIDKRLVRLVD